MCVYTYSQMMYVYCILIGCRCAPLQGDWRSCVLIGRIFKVSDGVCTYPQMTYTCMYIYTSKTRIGDCYTSCVFPLEGINLFKVSVSCLFALTLR